MTELFCSSVIGASHIKKGTLKEDYGLAERFDHCLVFCLGDGHGDPNCFRSNIGSKILCELTITALSDFAATAKSEELFGASSENLVRHFVNYLFGTWKGEVLKQLEENPFTESELEFMNQERKKGSNTVNAYDHGIQLEHIFGTTLIAGVLTDKYLLLLHQGDGRCTVMYPEGTYDEPVPWDVRCFSNLTTSVCDEDAIPSCRYKVFDLSKTPISACILSSDGLEDSLAVDSDLVHSYFDEILLYGAEHSADELSKYLNETLPEMTAKGSNDDITICGFFDPDIVLSHAELFLKRKQVIELNSALSVVELKIDSAERSGKMDMLRKRLEDAEHALKTLETEDSKITSELTNIAKNLAKIQSSNVDLSKFEQAKKWLRDFFLSLVFDGTDELAALSKRSSEWLQKSDNISSQIEAAKSALEQATAEYDAYKARYDQLLNRRDELKEEIRKLS